MRYTLGWLMRDAMGDDEYHPISHKGSNLTEAGGIGYTVVDSIDTMLLMGLDEEYQRARDWVASNMTFERDANFNTFETTIRVLGGLLSAYTLSEDPMFLERAKDLADRIMPTFDTPSGLPLSLVNLAKREGVPDKDNRGLVSTAEVSTLQLEFKYLSHLIDDESYWEKAETVESHQWVNSAVIHSPEDGRFALSAIRLGSRGDSYYEYLLSDSGSNNDDHRKQYIQTNFTEPVYKDMFDPFRPLLVQMYDDAINGVQAHLIQKSRNARLTYTSELIPERNAAGEMSVIV
ncbi:Mannosyl-oligosaccharide 1,2-alpha-mannosidase [Grifola frondosa]|uniref:alpha-1,2-Mannosidase n=1 Tax=Grifola frondosa TaxID=5627 RepID=A0A1C7M0K4_GRIFR|nr:Mannosyl-oligosaccharide 1,2-alpha-mannosidase [Grifola frondosa]